MVFAEPGKIKLFPLIYFVVVIGLDIANVLSAISSVGFPIVACIALFWNGHKQEERHLEESNKFNEAINNNTIALVKLTEKISYLGGVKDVSDSSGKN